jgi:hypothetical protein
VRTEDNISDLFNPDRIQNSVLATGIRKNKFRIEKKTRCKLSFSAGDQKAVIKQDHCVPLETAQQYLWCMAFTVL